MSGYGTKEARYNTRLAKGTREQVNLCGGCGNLVPGTELLCNDCRGTSYPRPTEEESDGERARR